VHYSPDTAFIFDMDGVLVNNMQRHALSWVELFRDFGLEGLDAERYLRETAGMKALDVLRHFLDPEITPAEADRLNELKDFLYRVNYRDHIVPMPGLEAFLQRAGELGIAMGVGTGATSRNIDFTLAIPGLAGKFNAVVGAEDVEHGKPSPDIFLKVAKHLGVHPSRCIVFEDAIPGIEAANRAGMAAIALSTTNPRELMAQCSGLLDLVDDFRDISPDTVIEKLSAGAYLPS